MDTSNSWATASALPYWVRFRRFSGRNRLPGNTDLFRKLVLDKPFPVRSAKGTSFISIQITTCGY